MQLVMVLLLLLVYLPPINAPIFSLRHLALFSASWAFVICILQLEGEGGVNPVNIVNVVISVAQLLFIDCWGQSLSLMCIMYLSGGSSNTTHEKTFSKSYHKMSKKFLKLSAKT